MAHLGQDGVAGHCKCSATAAHDTTPPPPHPAHPAGQPWAQPHPPHPQRHGPQPAKVGRQLLPAPALQGVRRGERARLAHAPLPAAHVSQERLHDGCGAGARGIRGEQVWPARWPVLAPAAPLIAAPLLRPCGAPAAPCCQQLGNMARPAGQAFPPAPPPRGLLAPHRPTHRQSCRRRPAWGRPAAHARCEPSRPAPARQEEQQAVGSIARRREKSIMACHDARRGRAAPTFLHPAASPSATRPNHAAATRGRPPRLGIWVVQVAVEARYDARDVRPQLAARQLGDRRKAAGRGAEQLGRACDQGAGGGSGVAARRAGPGGCASSSGGGCPARFTRRRRGREAHPKAAPRLLFTAA